MKRIRAKCWTPEENLPEFSGTEIMIYGGSWTIIGSYNYHKKRFESGSGATVNGALYWSYLPTPICDEDPLSTRQIECVYRPAIKHGFQCHDGTRKDSYLNILGRTSTTKEVIK